MKLQQASITDFASVLSFYNDVTERTPEIERCARWQKGKHPTAEGIKAYIQEGSLYLYKEQDAIIGAMAVTMCQGEDYHIGSEMIREAILLAKKKSMKAIHGTDIHYWYGTLEAFVAKPQVKHLKKIYPDVQVEVFPKMNHGQLLVDHPEEVAKRIYTTFNDRTGSRSKLVGREAGVLIRSGHRGNLL